MFVHKGFSLFISILKICFYNYRLQLPLSFHKRHYIICDAHPKGVKETTSHILSKKLCHKLKFYHNTERLYITMSKRSNISDFCSTNTETKEKSVILVLIELKVCENDITVTQL